MNEYGKDDLSDDPRTEEQKKADDEVRERFEAAHDLRKYHGVDATSEMLTASLNLLNHELKVTRCLKSFPLFIILAVVPRRSEAMFEASMDIVKIDLQPGEIKPQLGIIRAMFPDRHETVGGVKVQHYRDLAQYEVWFKEIEYRDTVMSLEAQCNKQAERPGYVE